MAFRHVILDGRGDQTWTTPLDVFQAFDARFKFELDACASDTNALCDKYFTERDDALQQDWNARAVWVNPPFAKAKKFVEKAVKEVKSGALVAMVIPANLNSCYWHDHILGQPNVEIHFPRRGLKFGGAKVVCPCPVAVVIFHPEPNGFLPFNERDSEKIGDLQPPCLGTPKNLDHPHVLLSELEEVASK